MVTTISRFLVLLSLLIAAGTSIAPAGASAQDQGIIEVHVSACPEDIGDRSLLDACHANGIVGDNIIIDGPVHQTAATSGDLGTVSFDNLPAGEYTIAEAVMTGDFSDYRVSCSDAANSSVPIDDRRNGRAAVAITLDPGAQVACDWYNIPPQELSSSPEMPSAGEATQVISMPATGTGPLGGHRALGLNLILLTGGSLLLALAGWLARRPGPLE